MSDTSGIKRTLRSLSDTSDGRAKARDMALRAIQKTPGDAELRVILAKLYYMDGLFEFATRELIEAQFLVPTPSVDKLLQQFTEYSAPLISRYKQFPKVGMDNRTQTLTSAPREQAKSSQEESNDSEVVADMDVDLDLFDE